MTTTMVNQIISDAASAVAAVVAIIALIKSVLTGKKVSASAVKTEEEK